MTWRGVPSIEREYARYVASLVFAKDQDLTLSIRSATRKTKRQERAADRAEEERANAARRASKARRARLRLASRGMRPDARGSYWCW